MNIETRKYKIIQKVIQSSDEQLAKIEAMLKEESELEAKLEKAMQQVKEGKVKPHSEVRKRYEKWL
ncbi:hypothetical protein [Cyclobacterium marinum]|uniref:Uncharacterized protein n=1 Tax=Cyclobacterium marinum (strain ATCC 25205 / DSM 745 / LMG 13164 / NCIMB 1802) TaxID=880070 RepID=G0J0A6_CYCMS|nr:hypothetical protein [Cyclobacterium marinum]AEL28179.1 hypothetical protein Cycma_4480 [Cyclobacterium marinum DSM 745]